MCVRVCVRLHPSGAQPEASSPHGDEEGCLGTVDPSLAPQLLHTDMAVDSLWVVWMF